MLVKSQVKYIQSLGQKKFRDEEGVFIAEGPKIIQELLANSNTRPRQIFALKGWLEEHAAALSGMAAAGIHELKEKELERISSLTTPNQVLAVFEKPVFPSSAGEDGIILLLDGLQDPGNLGTIVRIADWFGIGKVICSMDCADLYNNKTVQSTMASIIRVPVSYGDLEKRILEYDKGLPVFAAALEGKNLYSIGRIEKGMIVIGNESRGIRKELLARIPALITIPRKGQAESLNAAVATGIILSHLAGG
ncbi:TrmH family RNA methyltransferase [Flavitalea flava]